MVRLCSFALVAVLVAGCAAESHTGTPRVADDPDDPGATPTGWPTASGDADAGDISRGPDAPDEDEPPVALTGDVEWARGFAGFGDNAGRAVSISPEGHVVLTGHFWPSVDFGGGPIEADGYDAVVARYYADGTFASADCLGGTGNHYGSSVLAGANGISAVAGSFSGVLDTSVETVRAAGDLDGFVAIRDATGRDLYTLTMGGPFGRAEIASIAVDRDGSFYLAGRFLGEVVLGDHTLVSAGDWDGFAARIDSEGFVLWVETVATAARDAVTGVVLAPAVDASGAIVDYPVLVGYQAGAANDTGRAALIRQLDRLGATRWSHDLTGTGDAVIHGVAVAPGGRAVVVGSRQRVSALAPAVTSRDGFVASYAASGLEWVADIEGRGADEALGVAVAPGGDVLVTGQFESDVSVGATGFTSAGGTDIFVAKLSAAGELHWMRAFGWIGDDAGYAVAARADGGAVVTGQYSERLDFGTGPLPYSSQRDIFLLGLAP